MLSELLGTRAVALCPKQQNKVSQGWLSLRAVAAAFLLLQPAGELTLGQNIVIYVPHMVQLVQQEVCDIKTTSIANPALFFSAQQVAESPGHG